MKTCLVPHLLVFVVIYSRVYSPLIRHTVEELYIKHLGINYLNESYNKIPFMIGIKNDNYNISINCSPVKNTFIMYSEYLFE